jgi:hypothetical protein
MVETYWLIIGMAVAFICGNLISSLIWNHFSHKVFKDFLKGYEDITMKAFKDIFTAMRGEKG